MASIHGGSSSGEESSGGNGQKYTEEYLRKRERNNLSVKRTREKNKQKKEDMEARVKKLKSENDDMESNIKVLEAELGALKDVFIAHGGDVDGVRVNETELGQLLCDDIYNGVTLLMTPGFLHQ